MCCSSRVVLSPGFVLLCTAFLLLEDVRLLLLVLSAAALHELGHFAALTLCGGTLSRLTLTAFGAKMTTDAARLSYGREFFVLLAGPLTNLLWAAGLALAARQLHCVWCQTAAGLHLVLGLFNLLPIPPLDGGRMLRLCLTALLGLTAGALVSRLTTLALLTALGLAALSRGGSLWLCIGLTGLYAAAVQEMLANRGENG
ncbi:MAG: site-2 protease family protein [Oscillospiraceae bacterium]